ncbi:MAG: glycosyltransferase [Victivallales bacterium]|nr:glycosyltransferase [Victivallales bacterium]
MMSSNLPFFSIIIPCCDVEPYVRECLDSVLNQPFTGWECIIGIETSKDKTEEIVHEYETKDPRFRAFTGPRSGSCSASRNTGIDMATGEYVIFLDGDDTITEDSLQRLHDKIASRPEADIYPCAMLVHNDMTNKDEPIRDNYPVDFNGELTGPEATVMVYRYHQNPCPMLQLSVFRREFLLANDLKCIHGLRRQDSEFSPRALYLAKRVIPLHEPFYRYRIQSASVGSAARGAGYFHRDWAVILRSLLAFHAKVSVEPDFNTQISQHWARQWIQLIFFFWFFPKNIDKIPRALRVETLELLFANGFNDFNLLITAMPQKTKRVLAWWMRQFIRHPSMRTFSEWFFKCYFFLAGFRRKEEKA